MPRALFSIDPHGGEPLYLQLAEQIKRAVAIGSLAAGERLPTVKVLAHDLKINPNTVARVYRELERDGVIATAPGRGSFVRDQGALDQSRRVALDVARRGIGGAVQEARSLGVTAGEVRAIADAAISRSYPEEAQS